MATDAEIIRATKATRGNRTAAARRLGIDPKTVQRRILKLGADLCPPPWYGGVEPPESAPKSRRANKRLHSMEGCVQDIPIDHLAIGLNDLLDAGMEPETICRRFLALLATMIGDRVGPSERWTPERLAAGQEELCRAFLKW